MNRAAREETFSFQDPLIEGTQVFVDNVELKEYDVRDENHESIGSCLVLTIPAMEEKDLRKGYPTQIVDHKRITRQSSVFITTGKKHFKANPRAIVRTKDKKLELYVAWSDVMSRRADKEIEEEDMIDLSQELTQ